MAVSEHSPRMSAEYNRAPSLEKNPAPSARIQDDIAARIAKAVTGPCFPQGSTTRDGGDWSRGLRRVIVRSPLR